jgi:hypothetical protein
LGAVLRTVLVVGGFAVLLFGIVSLAYPPLMDAVAFEQDLGALTSQPDRTPGGTDSLVGPTMFLSLGAIVAGMTVVSAGLATPGRPGARLVPEQPFTRRQRLFTLVGSVFVIGLPATMWLATRLGVQSLPLVLVGTLLVVVGAVMVLVGTTKGLQQQRYRPRQNS